MLPDKHVAHYRLFGHGYNDLRWTGTIYASHGANGGHLKLNGFKLWAPILQTWMLLQMATIAVAI